MSIEITNEGKQAIRACQTEVEKLIHQTNDITTTTQIRAALSFLDCFLNPNIAAQESLKLKKAKEQEEAKKKAEEETKNQNWLSKSVSWVAQKASSATSSTFETTLKYAISTAGDFISGLYEGQTYFGILYNQLNPLDDSWAIPIKDDTGRKLAELMLQLVQDYSKKLDKYVANLDPDKSVKIGPIPLGRASPRKTIQRAIAQIQAKITFYDSVKLGMSLKGISETLQHELHTMFDTLSVLDKSDKKVSDEYLEKTKKRCEEILPELNSRQTNFINAELNKHNNNGFIEFSTADQNLGLGFREFRSFYPTIELLNKELSARGQEPLIISQSINIKLLDKKFIDEFISFAKQYVSEPNHGEYKKEFAGELIELMQNTKNRMVTEKEIGIFFSKQYQELHQQHEYLKILIKNKVNPEIIKEETKKYSRLLKQYIKDSNLKQLLHDSANTKQGYSLNIFGKYTCCAFFSFTAKEFEELKDTVQSNFKDFPKRLADKKGDYKKVVFTYEESLELESILKNKFPDLRKKLRTFSVEFLSDEELKDKITVINNQQSSIISFYANKAPVIIKSRDSYWMVGKAHNSKESILTRLGSIKELNKINGLNNINFQENSDSIWISPQVRSDIFNIVDREKAHEPTSENNANNEKENIHKSIAAIDNLDTHKEYDDYTELDSIFNFNEFFYTTLKAKVFSPASVLAHNTMKQVHKISQQHKEACKKHNATPSELGDLIYDLMSGFTKIFSTAKGNNDYLTLVSFQETDGQARAYQKYKQEILKEKINDAPSSTSRYSSSETERNDSSASTTTTSTTTASTSVSTSTTSTTTPSISNTPSISVSDDYNIPEKPEKEKEKSNNAASKSDSKNNDISETESVHANDAEEELVSKEDDKFGKESLQPNDAQEEVEEKFEFTGDFSAEETFTPKDNNDTFINRKFTHQGQGFKFEPPTQPQNKPEKIEIPNSPLDPYEVYLNNWKTGKYNSFEEHKIAMLEILALPYSEQGGFFTKSDLLNHAQWKKLSEDWLNIKSNHVPVKLQQTLDQIQIDINSSEFALRTKNQLAGNQSSLQTPADPIIVILNKSLTTEYTPDHMAKELSNMVPDDKEGAVFLTSLENTVLSLNDDTAKKLWPAFTTTSRNLPNFQLKTQYTDGIFNKIFDTLKNHKANKKIAASPPNEENAINIDGGGDDIDNFNLGNQSDSPFEEYLKKFRNKEFKTLDQHRQAIKSLVENENLSYFNGMFNDCNDKDELIQLQTIWNDKAWDDKDAAIKIDREYLSVFGSIKSDMSARLAVLREAPIIAERLTRDDCKDLINLVTNKTDREYLITILKRIIKLHDADIILSNPSLINFIALYGKHQEIFESLSAIYELEHYTRSNWTDSSLINNANIQKIISFIHYKRLSHDKKAQYKGNSQADIDGVITNVASNKILSDVDRKNIQDYSYYRKQFKSELHPITVILNKFISSTYTTIDKLIELVNLIKIHKRYLRFITVILNKSISSTYTTIDKLIELVNLIKTHKRYLRFIRDELAERKELDITYLVIGFAAEKNTDKKILTTEFIDCLNQINAFTTHRVHSQYAGTPEEKQLLKIKHNPDDPLNDDKIKFIQTAEQLIPQNNPNRTQIIVVLKSLVSGYKSTNGLLVPGIVNLIAEYLKLDEKNEELIPVSLVNQLIQNFQHPPAKDEDEIDFDNDTEEDEEPDDNKPQIILSRPELDPILSIKIHKILVQPLNANHQAIDKYQQIIVLIENIHSYKRIMNILDLVLIKIDFDQISEFLTAINKPNFDSTLKNKISSISKGDDKNETMVNTADRSIQISLSLRFKFNTIHAYFQKSLPKLKSPIKPQEKESNSFQLTQKSHINIDGESDDEEQTEVLEKTSIPIKSGEYDRLESISINIITDIPVLHLLSTSTIHADAPDAHFGVQDKFPSAARKFPGSGEYHVENLDQDVRFHENNYSDNLNDDEDENESVKNKVSVLSCDIAHAVAYLKNRYKIERPSVAVFTQTNQAAEILSGSNAVNVVPKNNPEEFITILGGMCAVSNAIISVKKDNQPDKHVKADLVFVSMPTKNDFHIFPTREIYLNHLTALVMMQFNMAKLSGNVLVIGRMDDIADDDLSAVVHAVNALNEFKQVKVVFALNTPDKKCHLKYIKPDKAIIDQVNDQIAESKNEYFVDDISSLSDYLMINYAVYKKNYYHINNIFADKISGTYFVSQFLTNLEDAGVSNTVYVKTIKDLAHTLSLKNAWKLRFELLAHKSAFRMTTNHKDITDHLINSLETHPQMEKHLEEEEQYRNILKMLQTSVLNKKIAYWNVKSTLFKSSHKVLPNDSSYSTLIFENFPTYINRMMHITTDVAKYEISAKNAYREIIKTSIRTQVVMLTYGRSDNTDNFYKYDLLFIHLVISPTDAINVIKDYILKHKNQFNAKRLFDDYPDGVTEILKIAQDNSNKLKPEERLVNMLKIAMEQSESLNPSFFRSDFTQNFYDDGIYTLLKPDSKKLQKLLNPSNAKPEQTENEPDISNTNLIENDKSKSQKKF
jgi:hypothetical protein